MLVRSNVFQGLWETLRAGRLWWGGRTQVLHAHSRSTAAFYRTLAGSNSSACPRGSRGYATSFCGLLSCPGFTATSTRFRGENAGSKRGTSWLWKPAKMERQLNVYGGPTGHQTYHLSIHPSILCRLSRVGILCRDAQAFLSPATSSNSTGGSPRRSQGSREM